MAEISFSDNYNDLSVASGADAGFQFEFRCERCGDAWRSEFVAYTSGRASGWLSKAAGMFGGVLGQVSDAADGLAEAGYGKAHDQAFAAAVKQAKAHFHRCARCAQHVCDVCWNAESGLCLGCAPDAEVLIESSRAEGEAAMAAELARTEGVARAAKRDVTRQRQLVCPACKAETHGAKFCPECGARLAASSQCSACNAKVAPGSKFCPECGQDQRK